MTCNNATINGTLEKTINNVGTVKIGKGVSDLIRFDYSNYSSLFALNSISFTMNNQEMAHYGDNYIALRNNNRQIVLINGINGYGEILLQNANGVSINLNGNTGDATFKGKVTAGNMDCGSGSCSSNGYTQVNFNKTFANVPKVVCTCSSNTNGVIALKTRNITTTGFEVTIGGSGFSTALSFDWIAMDI